MSVPGYCLSFTILEHGLNIRSDNAVKERNLVRLQQVGAMSMKSLLGI